MVTRSTKERLHRLFKACVSMNMAASWGVKHVLFCSITEYKSSSRQTGEPFLTTFAKLKVVSPTAMAKLAIDSASLESLVINREILIPNREIGRLS